MLHEVYADREIWSLHNSLWRTYITKKPRLPTAEDSTTEWVITARPRFLAEFFGPHNNQLFKHLREYREDFETERKLPHSILLYGSTGKSSIMHSFKNEIKDIAGSSKWVLLIDIAAHANKVHEALTQITNFVSKELKGSRIPFRLVILDNIDLISPSEQQDLKRIIEHHADTSRYLLTSSTMAKVIDNIVNLSKVHRIRPIAEKDALVIILRFCSQNKIGYDQEGIYELFKSAQGTEGIQMSSLFRTLQKTFVQSQFISAENVRKSGGARAEKMHIPLGTARLRCSICTLYPPCKHLSLADVCESNRAHRKALPLNKEAPRCIPFMRTAYCSSFDQRRRCWFAHPKNRHELVPPAEVCPQCSIAWLCNHCAFTATRQALQSTIAEIAKRQFRMRILLASDPPREMVAPIVSPCHPLFTAPINT